ACAVIPFAFRSERQFEQDLAGVPFPTGEYVRMDADLAQPALGIQMAQHLHDICRNMNAGADPFERPGLLENPDFEALALQQSGGRRPSEACSDDRNAGAAFHGAVLLHSKICRPPSSPRKPGPSARKLDTACVGMSGHRTLTSLRPQANSMITA